MNFLILMGLWSVDPSLWIIILVHHIGTDVLVSRCTQSDNGCHLRDCGAQEWPKFQLVRGRVDPIGQQGSQRARHLHVSLLNQLSPHVPSADPTFFPSCSSGLIVFQNIVPISLYISIEIVKTIQAFFIFQDLEMYYPELDTPCVPKTWDISDE